MIISKILKWLPATVLTLSVLSACQKAKLSQAPEPQQKTDDAKAACAELNLARDAAWTASFLREFVRCASIQNDKNQGTFDQSLNLIDRIGLDRLQRAMDLLLIEPKQGIQDSGVYPNLSAVITLMDRGVHDNRGQPLVDAEARWDTLQSSLRAVRPRPLFRFLMTLEEAEALDGFIEELVAFTDALPPAALAGLTHKILTDGSVRDDLQSLQRETLDDARFASALKTLWEESHKAFFWQDALRFWEKASTEERGRWAHGVAAFLRMGLETQREELLRRTHDLSELFRSYILRQDQFLTNIRELLQQSLKTSLKDLEPAMKGLTQIKDNPSYRDAFEEKAGSTYLHGLIEDFLWEGGRLQSCSLEFSGMKSDPGLSHPRAILQLLLTPQPACQGRVPLLLYIDETLGLNCRTGVCGRAWMSDEQTATAAEWKALGQFAWTWLEKELRADPYRLKNRQLAYEPVDGERLAQLKTFWFERMPENADDLVSADDELAKDGRFAGLLKKDFLESWYGLILQKLNTLPEEFRDVWPDTKNMEGWYQKNSDLKLQRVSLGLQAFGTMEAAAAQALPLTDSFAALHTRLGDVITAGDFSQIVNPTRELAGIIKNPNVSIKPETEKISLDWPGSISSFRAYLPDGTLARDAAPYAEDGWLMLTRYRDQLPLLTASADPSRAKELEAWIADQFLPQWTQNLKERTPSGAAALPWDLFEGEQLSADDIRMFTLFAAQNFLSVGAARPEGSRIASLPLTPVFTKERAPQAFLGIPVLSGSQQSWAGFWAFDGGFFKDTTTLKELLKKLPQNGSSLGDELLQAASNPAVLTQGRLNEIDRDKLIAPLKLMIQLQTVSSLYQSRGQQVIVPAVGFAAFCPSAQGPVDCPFTVQNFAAWRQYMEGRILDHYCPFISGTSFSAAFQKTWREALGFQDSQAELAQLCTGHTQTSMSISASVWEQNWLSLLKMGRNPQLRPALVQIPEAIRRLKVQKVSGDYQKFVRYLELAPLWMPIANARLQHREAVYAAFRWHAPGLIDHVIAAYNHEMGDRTFTDALKKLGRLSAEGTNPVFDLIQTVTDAYAASVKAQETTLTFILRVADQISQNPQLIQTTSRLLEKPEDPFAGILLAYTFPQAMKVGVFEDFAWDHPSYRLMRLAFQAENRRLILGLVAAFDRLSPKLWKIYQDMASAFPDRQTMARDGEKLLGFAVDLIKDGKSSGLWRELMQKGPSDDALLSLIRLTHQLRDPLLDLQNQWQAALKDQMNSVVFALIQGTLRMMPWIEKLPSRQSFDLMKDSLQGLSAGLYGRHGSELWRLLQDQRLGLGTEGILMQELRDPSLRADVRLIAHTLWNLDTEWVLAALDEWEELARSTGKTLRYFEKNVTWRGPGAVSYQYFIKTLDRQMQDGQKKLREQLDLLRVWLQDDDCGKGGTAC